ncbi:MAG: hypothetical protein FH762_19605 [Firmicutes bacterium]|nr:hypothetical protein [Bacillota bacterium]
MGKIIDKLPRWEGEILEPPESKKDNGWLAGERPPFNWLNWLFNRIYIGINTLDDDYGTHKESNTGVHGVGTSSIESTEGSQQKVDNHAGEISGVHGVGTSSVASEEYADSVAATAEQNAKSYANTLVVPPGAVLWFSGDTPPDGFLVPEGVLLSRTTYADLWNHAQNSGMIVTDAEWNNGQSSFYSDGDGSTVFRIPDWRGEFFRAADLGRGVDSGRELGSWQEDAFESHTHDLSRSLLGGTTSTATGSVAASGIGSVLGFFATKTGGSETRPRNVALLPCIKY